MGLQHPGRLLTAKFELSDARFSALIHHEQQKLGRPKTVQRFRQCPLPSTWSEALRRLQYAIDKVLNLT
jgi:hypothetical protein